MLGALLVLVATVIGGAFDRPILGDSEIVELLCGNVDVEGAGVGGRTHESPSVDGAVTTSSAFSSQGQQQKHGERRRAGGGQSAGSRSKQHPWVAGVAFVLAWITGTGVCSP